VDQSLLTFNDTPQKAGLSWTSDQPVAETSTWQHTTLITDKHPCPTIPAGERQQTYALDHEASGTGHPRIRNLYFN